MSSYRELTIALGDAPLLDFLFEFKLLPKMDELQPTGTQHEYTIKFMWLMSHSSVEILEVVKRWFYH